MSVGVRSVLLAVRTPRGGSFDKHLLSTYSGHGAVPDSREMVKISASAEYIPGDFTASSPLGEGCLWESQVLIQRQGHDTDGLPSWLRKGGKGGNGRRLWWETTAPSWRLARHSPCLLRSAEPLPRPHRGSKNQVPQARGGKSVASTGPLRSSQLLQASCHFEYRGQPVRGK